MRDKRTIRTPAGVLVPVLVPVPVPAPARWLAGFVLAAAAAAAGCSTVPSVARPEPAANALRLKIAVAPVSSVVEPGAGPAAHGRGGRPARLSPTAPRSMPVDATNVRDEVVVAMREQGLFTRVGVIDSPRTQAPAPGVLRGAAGLDLDERRRALEAAAARGDDLVLFLEVTRHDVRYVGANDVLPWKVLVWLNFWIPAWWMAERDFEADFELEAELVRASTGQHVYSRKHRETIVARLDDFDYGFHALSLLRVPNSLGDENWEAVAESLLIPARSRAEVALLAELEPVCRGLLVAEPEPRAAPPVSASAPRTPPATPGAAPTVPSGYGRPADALDRAMGGR